MTAFTSFPIPRKDVSELDASQQELIRSGLGLPDATTPEMEAGTETDPRSMSPANVAEAIAALAEGGSLDTDATILATPDDDLAAKYAEAKALTPNSNPLSKTNRAALVLMPGVYTLSAELAVDTNYVDVIALGSATKTPSVSLLGGNINVTAWDVDIIGIKTNNFNLTARANITTGVTGTASTNTVNITGHGLVVGDVISFQSITGGSGLTTNVRYVLRTAAANTFQLSVESTGANANFTTNITAGNVRIQSNTSQRITNCVGGDDSFGGNGGVASGTFTNCSGGSGSFGGLGGVASGTFTNCTGGIYAFGGDGTALGTFTNCTGGIYAFGGAITASGVFTNCTGGDYAFGGDGDGTASGTFTGCTGGSNAFGGEGTLTGKLYYCRLTSGAFETVSGGGIIRNCVDGNNNKINQGGDIDVSNIIVLTQQEYDDLPSYDETTLYLIKEDV
jgi:hypothetical protein